MYDLPGQHSCDECLRFASHEYITLLCKGDEWSIRGLLPKERAKVQGVKTSNIRVIAPPDADVRLFQTFFIQLIEFFRQKLDVSCLDTLRLENCAQPIVCGSGICEGVDGV